MNINDVTTLIGSLGFPIVCCIAMFWQNQQFQKAHNEETINFVKAIENNTTAIEKLYMVMDKEIEK